MKEDNFKNLCAYVEEGVQVNDPRTYIALFRPATRYCEGCGCSAANTENLCKP